MRRRWCDECHKEIGEHGFGIGDITTWDSHNMIETRGYFHAECNFYKPVSKTPEPADLCFKCWYKRAMVALEKMREILEKRKGQYGETEKKRPATQEVCEAGV